VVDELGVYYDTAVVDARLRRARRALLMRVAMPVVFAAIMCLLWWLAPDQTGSFAPLSLVLFGAFTVLAFGWDFIRLRAVQTDARRAVGGLALGVNRDGALIGQTWFRWSDVATVVMTPGRFGASDRLVITARDQRSEWLPIACTDAVPGWLDSVVRALSGGRVGIDWSRLDV